MSYWVGKFRDYSVSDPLNQFSGCRLKTSNGSDNGEIKAKPRMHFGDQHLALHGEAINQPNEVSRKRVGIVEALGKLIDCASNSCDIGLSRPAAAPE